MFRFFCLLLLFTWPDNHTVRNVTAQDKLKRLIIIAHRGDHTEAPENTLKAFSDAITTGVDYVEVDVRSTRDGELVVMHDATVDRMTSGHGKVSELTWDELQQLTVVNKDHPEYGQYKIPSFTEVLKLCKGKIGIYLDFKDGNVAKAWQLIREYGMSRTIVVYLNAEQHLGEWKAHAPEVPLIASLPDSVKDAGAYIKFHRVAGVQIVDGRYADYTSTFVHDINKNGQSVWLDVQEPGENEASWSKVLALGVQGMQTDHPREMVRWRDRVK